MATLVLALVAAVAAVPAVDAKKKKAPKPVNKVKQANVPIPVATPGPPFTTGRATSTINVPSKKKFSIRDIDVDIFVTTVAPATADGLDIYIKGPGGATRNLSFSDSAVPGGSLGTSCNGGSMYFDDQASKPFTSDDPFDPATDDPNSQEIVSYPPHAGKVQPAQSLNSTFKGTKSNGVWTLLIFNFSDTDPATLVCWSLHLKPQKPPGTSA